MDQMKIKGHPDLVRDVSSGAVVNKNQEEYLQYIESYKKRQSQRARMDNLEDELSSLRDDMQEIKSLLKKLVSK